MKNIAVGVSINSIDMKNRIILPKNMFEGLNYLDEENKDFIIIEHDNYLSVHNFNDILQQPITELKKYEFFIENVKIGEDRRLLLKKRFIDSLDIESPVIIFGRINRIDIVPNSQLQPYLDQYINDDFKKEILKKDIKKSLEKKR